MAFHQGPGCLIELIEACFQGHLRIVIPTLKLAEGEESAFSH
jgi:hypothetical protein